MNRKNTLRPIKVGQGTIRGGLQPIEEEKKPIVALEEKPRCVPIPEKSRKKTGPRPLSRSTIQPDKTRYSDEDLVEFRTRIMNKLDIARSELKYLQDDISRKSEIGSGDDARYGGIDESTTHNEREHLSHMAARQLQHIAHLEQALIRIKNKTYGICRETGKLISKERLRAVPHASLSMEAKATEKVA